jgi:hypothetical protein
MKALPKLTGSEKQIRWAETIRIKVIANFEQYLANKKESTSYHKMIAAFEKLLTITESKWWIEHKEYEKYYIQKLYMEIYCQYKLFKKEEK